MTYFDNAWSKTCRCGNLSANTQHAYTGNVFDAKTEIGIPAAHVIALDEQSSAKTDVEQKLDYLESAVGAMEKDL